MFANFSRSTLALFLLATTPSFAANCDDHCLEQLLSQITTLREEIKSVIPVGAILPYSGNGALPQGYVTCDGSALNRAEYPKLFEVIGHSFTPENERGGNQFRVPNLGGKTLIGTQPPIVPARGIQLGEEKGSETQQLTVAHLPPHQHSGTTGDNDRGHTHQGRTGDDTPDPVLLRGISKLPPGVMVYAGGMMGLNGMGAEDFNKIRKTQPSPSPGPIAGYGLFYDNQASTKHQHDFTTGNQSTNHKHPFVTDNGAGHGLAGSAFSVMQPSIGMRFMIKYQ